MFIQEKDDKVQNPGHFTEFLFRQGVFSGRSQAGFVKRVSPRSRGHSHLGCLEAKYFSQDNFCSHSNTCTKVSASLLGAAFLGHPLFLLKAEPGMGASQQQRP